MALLIEYMNILEVRELRPVEVTTEYSLVQSRNINRADEKGMQSKLKGTTTRSYEICFMQSGRQFEIVWKLCKYGIQWRFSIGALQLENEEGEALWFIQFIVVPASKNVCGFSPSGRAKNV